LINVFSSKSTPQFLENDFFWQCGMMPKIFVLWIIELLYGPPHKLVIHIGLDASNNPVFNEKNYYGKSEEWVLKRNTLLTFKH
jgi:hypothetical protein